MVAMSALSFFFLGCSPYDHHDAEALQNATARFGYSYRIHATPEPTLRASHLAFTATFNTSKCADVRWSLEVDAGHALGDVLVAVRHEEATRHCDEYRVTPPFTGRVHISLESRHSLGSAVLLALPPGSEYELMRLENPSPDRLERPSFAGLAPPCPAAGFRLFVHRAQPKVENPNGPCSTLIEVDAQATVDEVRALASARLGVEVAYLREEGAEDKELHYLVDEAQLVAFENGHQQRDERAPAPQHLRSHTSTISSSGHGSVPNCTVR